MTKVSQILYTSTRIFWSIYFVFWIGVVGFVSAYMIVIPLMALSFITQKRQSLSLALRLAAESFLCFSIRFLLWIQPWLRLQHNLHGIYGFFDRYQTRKVMFIGNHRSNLDTFIMISLVPGLRGLAKSSLFYNVFFAPIMLLVGFIPSKKGDLNSYYQGLQQLKTRVLNRNRAVLIFPETTRSEKNFTSVGKFSRATFDVALDTNALVIPFLVSGTDRLMGRGDLFLNPYEPVSITLLPVIDTKKYASASQLSNDVWTLITDEQKKQGVVCS